MTQQPTPNEPPTSTSTTTAGSSSILEYKVQDNLARMTVQHLRHIVQDAVRLQRRCKRPKLSAVDVHLAMRCRYPPPSGSSSIYSGGSSSSSVVGRRRSSKAVNLNSYIQSEMPVVCPREPGLAMHWLSVDGVQPMIPMNVAMVRGAVREDYDGDGDGDGDVYENGSSEAEVNVRQLMPHVLSEELRTYFMKISLAIEDYLGDDSKSQKVTLGSAVSSMRNDSGIQELVPFFVKFLTQQIYVNLDRTDDLRILLAFVNAMMDNVHLHLELHLHQIFPSILTCVIARRLSRNVHDDHWSLRMEAAALLFKACNKYPEYTTLKSRVIKAYVEALAADRPLPSQFGGVVGITSFGPLAVEAFLIPSASHLWDKWQFALDGIPPGSEETIELSQCQNALLFGLGKFYANGGTLGRQEKSFDASAFLERFSEKLSAFEAHEVSYINCIL